MDYKDGVFNFRFVLTEDIQKQYDDYIAECEKIADHTAIGGRYSYVVTPTSLGTAVMIEDSISKKVLDLTDYNTW